MADGQASNVLAWGRMASGEGCITQFADSRMAKACCFAGKSVAAGGSAVLEKFLVTLFTGADVTACYCCHFSHDVLAT